MSLQFSQQNNKPQRETIICEMCGAKLLKDYAYSYYLLMATTGHAYVQAFDCANTQHWGCSADHALQAAVICAQEHLHPTLLQKHEEMNNSNKKFVSLEDEQEFANNEHFPFIKE